ncbi:MAG: methyltransferase domain-containing protein [Flavitalea sp.]
MSFRKYFKYFRFIQQNWHFRLAAFTIYHEIIGEKKYGIDTTGTEQLWEYDIEHKDLKDAEAYQPSSYYILEKLMDSLPAGASKGRIIDFGCGKGRTLAVAMAYGFTKLTGVDIIYEYIEAAQENIRICKFYNRNISYDLVNKRAQDLAISDDTTVFVFFNPFKENVMKKVVDNIMDSYDRSPRKIFVVYMNDVYRNLFLSKGFKQHAQVQKLTYLQGVVLSLS